MANADEARFKLPTKKVSFTIKLREPTKNT